MAVFQYVLLFGSEVWVITPFILRELGSLHNWVEQRLSDRIPRYQNGQWD